MSLKRAIKEKMRNWNYSITLTKGTFMITYKAQLRHLDTLVCDINAGHVWKRRDPRYKKRKGKAEEFRGPKLKVGDIKLTPKSGLFQ